MRAIALTALLLLAAIQAQATTLLAARPGVMCKTADATAKLTLPDGSNRGELDHPRPQDQKTYEAGACVDITAGMTVTLLTARKNTSIVLYKEGPGPAAQFIAPNIDFIDAAAAHPPAWADANYPPLIAMNTLLTAVNRRCPQQGWHEHNLSHTETGPWDQVDKTLTPAQSAAIAKETRFQCQMGLSCPADIQFGMEVQFGHLPELVRAICSQAAPAGD